MQEALDTTDESALLQEEEIVADYLKLKMMQHMADGLEDEADSVCCRAESLEEQEFLLVRNIDEHQTEINRLLLKLQGIRSERYGLLERIDRLRSEVSVLREKVWTGEDELALKSLENPETDGCVSTPDSVPEPKAARQLSGLPPHDIPAQTCYEGEASERGPALPKGAAPVFFKIHAVLNAPARSSALANCQ